MFAKIFREVRFCSDSNVFLRKCLKRCPDISISVLILIISIENVRKDVQRSELQMFTDGLTNKLVGGWKEGARDDTVLVR